MSEVGKSEASLPAPALPPAPARRLANAAVMVVFLGALFLPAYLYGDDRYWLPLFSKFMALALFAISVDLVWGYTGLLSLGQGLYFGLGAYAMGYCLVLRRAAEKADTPFIAAPDMALPDFMEYCRLDEVPWLIRPLIDFRLAVALMVLVPLLVAFVFGWFTFWMRVKGVFFALVTQTLLFAVYLVVYSNQPYTGGVVGMRDLAKIRVFDYKFDYYSYFYLTTGFLVIGFLGCTALIKSKFGKVLTAIRDSEFRVQALGYNTAMYKTFVFALAGAIAGIAGGLYVATQGTAGLDRFGIAFSIEIVIWVAVGGRGTLYGAVLGTILVNWANTVINNANQDIVERFGLDKEFQLWRYILAGLFIGTVVFLPNGIIGGVKSAALWAQRKVRRARTGPLVGVEQPSEPAIGKQEAPLASQGIQATSPMTSTSPPPPSHGIQHAPNIKGA